MITDWLFNALVWPLNALIGTLPTATGSWNFGLNTQATSITASGFWPHLGWVNDYIPLDQAVLALSLLLLIVLIMTTVNITLWIISQFWGKGPTD